MSNTLSVFLWIINIFSGLSIIFLVLMQQGKGAAAGASFGGGSSQGVFGASGSDNFLSRSTAIATIIFFTTCLMLAYSATQRSVVDVSRVNSSMAIEKTKPAVKSDDRALPDSTPTVNGGAQVPSQKIHTDEGLVSQDSSAK
ncbi:MAG: preprotein translocase subunit SecG [Neisseriaceae bacterium]|nr:MAG: preprotein translocase subunit SecG [Neisseriaceae bacterium]